MRSKDMARRGFLQRAGASAIAVSGMTLVPGTSTLAAQETAGLKPMGVPYDVHAFGATGDGKTIDSPAINRAIDAAAANGGGTVYFRAGNYLCYSIHLKSKVALFLDQGARLLRRIRGRTLHKVTIRPNRTSRGRAIRITDTITGTTV